MKKQTSAGCPRALGLEADALSSARPVRTLPCPWACRINRSALIFFPFLKKTPSSLTLPTLTAGSAEGEMRPFAGNFLTSVNFFQDLAVSQCEAL